MYAPFNATDVSLTLKGNCSILPEKERGKKKHAGRYILKKKVFISMCRRYMGKGLFNATKEKCISVKKKIRKEFLGTLFVYIYIFLKPPPQKKSFEI